MVGATFVLSYACPEVPHSPTHTTPPSYLVFRHFSPTDAPPADLLIDEKEFISIESDNTASRSLIRHLTSRPALAFPDLEPVFPNNEHLLGSLRKSKSQPFEKHQKHHVICNSRHFTERGHLYAVHDAGFYAVNGVSITYMAGILLRKPVTNLQVT